MFRKITLLAITLVPLGAAPGCADFTPDDARAFRDQAAHVRDDLAARAGELEALRETYPEGTPERADLEAAIDGAAAKAAALDAAISRMDLVLAEADAPTDGLAVAARDLGAYLPEPARLPLLLAGALGATLLRARQLKKGAGSIARSLSTAMKGDPELQTAVARNADTLRTIQTPTARRIVDEHTKDTPMIRLPI